MGIATQTAEYLRHTMVVVIESVVREHMGEVLRVLGV